MNNPIARPALAITTFVFCAFAGAPAMASAQRPADLPLQFDASGTFRTRYEHLWNSFQTMIPGNDMALSLRTNVLAELRFESVGFAVELMDSRVYLADDDTPLNTTHVNPVDVLQAYMKTNVTGLFARGAQLRLQLGRQTMDVGSRRFVARNRFRNTINAFTGLDVEWTSPGEEGVRAFVTVPVQRRVNSIRDNEPQLDIERTETIFWGATFSPRRWPGSIRAEFQLYGIHERDSDEYQTRNRNFVTPAIRLIRAPRPGLFDFEIETAVQTGTSRLTAQSADTADLTHFAVFVHAAVGHTFPVTWQPRLVLQYDYASGDKDPADAKDGRFDTLYGARRFEYGPTGIYGAFARSNVNSPGLRIEARPHTLIDGFLAYRPYWLAQARDGWTTTSLQDVNGTSGTFLGHQIEGRVRWQVLKSNATIETGFARLWLGGLPRNAPSGDPDRSDPIYGYAQLTLQI